MKNIEDSLLIRAIKRQPVHRTPVWLMRQAGRYLPEYQKVRAKAGDFMSLCKNKELACEVTLQPLRRFQLDAAILFSDILTIPDAMDLGLHFVAGEGPCFQRPLHTPASIEALRMPIIKEELAYVMDAVRLIRKEMPADLPLIGFSGSPWTLACYMVQGKNQDAFQRAQSLIRQQPELAKLLLEKLASLISEYLSQQVQAGVNLLMIFDTWGGLLSPEEYLQFSLFYMQGIVSHLKRLHPNIPLILFSKGVSQCLNEMAETGCDALGLDWTLDIGTVRKSLGNKVALQGNLDPAILLCDGETIQKNVHEILSSYGAGSGHIFNLGHGITPDVPIEHVRIMVDAVHVLSPAFHETP